MTQNNYSPQEVEAQAQRDWERSGAFDAREDSGREKFYCLCMFPYPSGRLHMGHVRNYTIGDVVARFHRMRGYEVLQPMGWDAFGLPAENAAIKNGVPPAEWTYANIAAMRDQLKRMGFAYDWRRELATCRPEYYRWEQWFFLRLYEQRLAYRKTAPVNWCPSCATVLANEQVEDGRCWRCASEVERRSVAQWFLNITAYADELLQGLDELPGWPEAVRAMQRNWIGRSEGLSIDFPVPGEAPVRVFTTRPDTLMGVTYMAVAPEHPLARRAAERDQEVARFVEGSARAQTSEAALETMEKRGMPLGVEARHPLTGEPLPVWVANFVLMAYGSGAVMSVPAHDARDWAFARQYGLPLRQVIEPADGRAVDLEEGAFSDYGVVCNSGDLDGLTSEQAFETLAERFEQEGAGQRQVNYRLRDWGVSRQRYWGAPIPMIHCAACGTVPVPEKDLPVVLPENVHIQGPGSPLAEMPEFYAVDCPNCGAAARRETDTFDTFMESSWYFARYASYDQHRAMLDARARQWLPVNQYIGGVEHAIMHLLYARFYHKLLRDHGLASGDEPFTRLLTQGMVLKDGAKMSKSKGNTVDPQAMVDAYGADTVRLYMMFTAPPAQSLDWSNEAVEGPARFLRRLWRLVYEHRDHSGEGAELDENGRALRRKLHETIQKVTDDMGRRQTFNTAVAAVMELVNALTALPDKTPGGAGLRRQVLEAVVLMLSPVVPHITHVLWQALGHSDFVMDQPWPEYDPQAMAQERIELVVQVNGRVRGRIQVPADAAEGEVETAALAQDNVARFVEDRIIRKRILVPGKLLNLVV
jgi:leucyl-tRNA synthetase